jgi:hypothetical protein
MFLPSSRNPVSSQHVLTDRSSMRCWNIAGWQVSDAACLSNKRNQQGLVNTILDMMMRKRCTGAALEGSVESAQFIYVNLESFEEIPTAVPHCQLVL